jgi:hypothetical protein
MAVVVGTAFGIVVIALVLAAYWIFVFSPRRLRSHFGTEYDVVLARTGSRLATEHELSERIRQHREFELRQLTAEQRDGYRRGWVAAQVHFVDAPGEAVAEAKALVSQVSDDLGYPVVDGDHERRLADLSAGFPRAVSAYRDGCALADRSDATTEDLRQALLRLRTAMDHLLDQPATTGPSTQAIQYGHRVRRRILALAGSRRRES